jgi:zinc protease
MSLRLALSASFAFCLLLPAVGQAAVPAPIVTQSAGVTILSQPDAAAPLVEVMLVVPAGLNRQRLSQSGLAALTAETILRTPVDGVALQDAVRAQGGSIHFVVDPSDVRLSIQALPRDANAILALVRGALANPTFDPATVTSARDALMARIQTDQQIALRVGLDMLNGTLASSANEGLPQYGIPALLAQLGPAQARAFYQAYYVRGASYVSAAGRLDALAPGALDRLAQTLPLGTTKALTIDLPKLEGATHQLVAHRDVPAPWLIAQYAAPGVASKDFGPMLVLAAFMQRTLSDIAEVPGVVSPTFASQAVGAVYRYEDSEPNLLLYVNGGIGDANRSFATALSIASILAANKLTGSIDDFKAMAAGDFINDSTSLETRAWLAVLFERSGGSPDYVARTLNAIADTNAADVQRVAKQYLGKPTIALVLPRSPS